MQINMSNTMIDLSIKSKQKYGQKIYNFIDSLEKTYSMSDCFKNDLSSALKQCFEFKYSTLNEILQKITDYRSETKWRMYEFLLWILHGANPDETQHVVSLNCICSPGIIKYITDLNKLQNLVYLNLSYCGLYTYLPFSSNICSKLQILILSHNMIQIVPREICNMTQLVELYIDNNILTSINEHIYKLSMLNILNVQHNRLKQLPSKIKLMNLVVIDCSHNYISDSIHTLFNPMHMKIINCDYYDTNQTDMININIEQRCIINSQNVSFFNRITQMLIKKEMFCVFVCGLMSGICGGYFAKMLCNLSLKK